MNDNHQGLSGPDFLHAVADAESASGNPINADIYRRRAEQWQRDLNALDKALATAILPTALTPTVLRHSGAITPSDFRS